MEMQKTLGKIEHAVDRLSTDMDDVKNKVVRTEKILFAAGVVLTIALVIGGWMVNTAKDVAVESYKVMLEQIKPQPVAPPLPAPQGKK